MKPTQRMALFASIYLLALPAEATQLWQSFSLSYLYGKHYEVGANKRRVLTVEHASGHDWGDNFFFLDHTTFEDNTVTNYFELSPRLSLRYLANKKPSPGWLKDIYLASTWEGGEFNNYLLGVGVSLNVTSFKYIGINVYHANNDLGDDDQQITLNWALPFSISKATFLYDGFVDYSNASDTNAQEINFTSQLKWNISSLLGIEAQVYLGIEYANWINKYGIKGEDEKNPNLLFKWHF